MSLKTELKGVVLAVMAIETVGEKNTRKQTIMVTQSGYRDEWGDQVGEDELWQIDIMGEYVDKFKFDESFEKKRIKCVLRLKSNTIKKKEGGEMFIINATLNSFELAPEK